MTDLEKIELAVIRTRDNFGDGATRQALDFLAHELRKIINDDQATAWKPGRDSG